MQIQAATGNEVLISATLEAQLQDLYRADGRHYHGMAHIESLLDLADAHVDLLADPEAVRAAIWFHDAIYDSRRSDNEARSAALAREKLFATCDPDRLSRIAAMIEATATHIVPEQPDGAARRDAALFLDMDLSILGSSKEAFDAYEEATRREYAWVDEAAWRAGRSAVLKRFLGCAHIFHTKEFRKRFEAQARSNMARSLAALAG